MNHPYVIETLTRQKIDALTEEGLRTQELKRLTKGAKLRNASPQPVEAEEGVDRQRWFAASLRRLARRIAWSSPTGINIEL